MQNYFINIPFNGSNAKNTIYNNFNYEIKDELYHSNNEDEIPIIYNFLHKYIKSLGKNLRPIIFSPDYSISSATCTAMAERFLEKIEENQTMKYISPLKVIYLTSTAHLNTLENISALDFSRSLLSNTFGECEISYTNHNFIINPKNFYLIGLNEDFLENDDVAKLKTNEILYFTLKNIKKKSIKNICEFLKDQIGEEPVYIIYDLSVLSFETSPCTFRINGKDLNPEKLNGLNNSEITMFFDEISNLNIVGLDITGFNLKENTPDIPFKITTEACKLALTHLLKVKEKKINILNENTKIVICRPIDINDWNSNTNKLFVSREEKKKYVNKIIEAFKDNDEIEEESDSEKEECDEDDGLGWYIMRGLTTQMKEQIIQKLLNAEDNIILYNEGNDSMYISFTSLEEQKKKSYYDDSVTLKDRVLYPGEKLNMIFSQL